VLRNQVALWGHRQVVTEGNPAMLLLIRLRYPFLATVLGIVVALAALGIGIGAHHPAMTVMGAASLALSVARLRAARRTTTTRTSS
jgi:hypothetical protein